MIVGQRIKARLPKLGISQAELARRVGMSQSGMVNLIAGRSRSTTYLYRIALELRTTSQYLAGETDDPSENAPPPVPSPTAQHLLMPVAFPSEEALSQMFLGLLLSLEAPNAAELAPELAKLLPTGLQTLRGPLRFAHSVGLDDPDDADEVQPIARPVRRRA